MIDIEERVTKLSMGGVRLGYVPGHEAHRLIREKRAIAHRRTRKQLQSIKMLHVGVEAEVPRATKLTYRETHAGHSIVCLKRYSHGIWHKWDNTLSFAELRDGALKSAETLARQRDERVLRNTA